MESTKVNCLKGNRCLRGSPSPGTGKGQERLELSQLGQLSAWQWMGLAEYRIGRDIKVSSNRKCIYFPNVCVIKCRILIISQGGNYTRLGFITASGVGMTQLRPHFPL